MSNENSNLRVGSAGAGLFVGSTEILGGGVENLLKEITIEPDFINQSNQGRILIANLSDNDGITLEREGIPTVIPARHIECYSIDIDAFHHNLKNYGQIPVRCLCAYVENGSNYPKVYFTDITVLYEDSCMDFTTYFTAILIFNAI